MTAALVILILVLLLGLLRARLHNRWLVQTDVGQLRLQRTLGSVVREVLGPWIAVLVILAPLLALGVMDAVTAALVFGMGCLFLVGYLAAVLRLASVTFDLGAERLGLFQLVVEDLEPSALHEPE